MSPETWMVLSFFVLVSVPVFVLAVALANRATDDTGDELEELKRRVEELESERE